MLKLRPFSLLLSLLILISGFGLLQATEHPTQQIQRVNPRRDPGKSSQTLKECLGVPDCLSLLTLTLKQLDVTTDELAADQRRASATVNGDRHHYEFLPEPGQRFCRAVLLKLSVVPTFESTGPVMTFAASSSGSSIDVEFKQGPARTWFDGIVILTQTNSLDEKCTLKDEVQTYSCTGKCETVKF